MRTLAANQLTQEMYGQQIRFAIPVRRGQSVQTMVLGHVHIEGSLVIIRAKGAAVGDDYRVDACTLVEVRS